MSQTARVALPTLVAGQIGKELVHNEALQLVDLLVCPVIEAAPSGTAPSAPVIGQCFAVAVGAGGAWAGKDGQLAGWTDGGWRFVTVPEGTALRLRATGVPVVKTSSGWETGVARADEYRVNGTAVVKSQQPAIAAPTGGTTNDAQSRAVIAQILAALRAHGLIAT